MYRGASVNCSQGPRLWGFEPVLKADKLTGSFVFGNGCDFPLQLRNNLNISSCYVRWYTSILRSLGLEWVHTYRGIVKVCQWLELHPSMLKKILLYPSTLWKNQTVPIDFDNFHLNFDWKWRCKGSFYPSFEQSKLFSEVFRAGNFRLFNKDLNFLFLFLYRVIVPHFLLKIVPWTIFNFSIFFFVLGVYLFCLKLHPFT